MSLISYGYLCSDVRDTNSRFIKLDENRLRAVLRNLLELVAIDEKWYLETYSDVRAAFRQGKFSSAREHYVNSGYFEDRLPRPIKVDVDWYLETYPDVAEAIRNKKCASAQEHFEANGFKEGRQPFEGWSLITAVAKKF
ncbi:hypothetical protein [Rhodoblastus sp.]|uniref:hypothetical protein n=1 Tax=Rhodoblastus sp. TaxID=1962975 RepID=UPI0026141E8D|nr:hypothetical protein [Rhodoblastus sp.]